MEVQNCRFCQKKFQIPDEDFTFYEKLKIPPPTLCVDDRQRRRAAFRNERNLYRRKCDATGKNIISMYSPDKPFKVYDREYWWNDTWNPLEYGRDVDFSRPFFEQYRELQLAVPRVSSVQWQSENSDYTNHSAKNKNCYMGVDLGGCEDVLYSNLMTNSKDCVDCSYTYESELCYCTLYAKNCYNCNFCEECSSCADCCFCYDCKGCRYCFGCTGLRNKEYYVLNKPVAKEEFEKVVQRYSYSWASQKEAQKKARTMELTIPHRFAAIMNSEECTGDYIYDSKNAKECFDAVSLWDCKYCYNTLDTKNGYDCYQPGFQECELIYEIHGGMGLYNSKFLHISRNLKDCEYCDSCNDSDHLFGCIGLRHGKYCILNKQYEKEEYEKTRERLIQHMKETGEYGEFFPLQCSPFGYNESKAQEYYPLTREQAEDYGCNWSDYIAPPPEGEGTKPPDDIRQVDDAIVNKILICEETKKPFIIIKQELAFYRRKKLPIPQLSPQRRYEKRMALRRPRKLWNRTCQKCGATVETAYAPERPEIIFCEVCYQKELY